MVSYHVEKNILLEKIKIDSDAYLLEYSHDEALKKPPEGAYVQNFAVPFPPVLVKEKGRYHPVIGKKFIHGMGNGKNLLPNGLIITKSGKNEDFFKYLLLLKQQFGGFNVIEKSIALKKLKQSAGRVDPEVLSFLDIPNNQQVVQNYILLADVPSDIKSLVLSKKLHEQTVFNIFRFKKKYQKELAEFISEIKLGTRKKNQLLDMIYYICKRENSEAGDILRDREITNILSLEVDPPHIGEKLYEYIHARRYPVMHQYQKELEKKLKQTGIRRDFHITLPRDFEKWEFKLCFNFSSAQEFNQKVKKLTEIGKEKSFQNLMAFRY